MVRIIPLPFPTEKGGWSLWPKASKISKKYWENKLERMSENKMRQRPPDFVQRKNLQLELFREFESKSNRASKSSLRLDTLYFRNIFFVIVLYYTCAF